jgi:hypothetical protein
MWRLTTPAPRRPAAHRAVASRPGQPFDAALALLENVMVTLDQLTGNERRVEPCSRSRRAASAYRIRDDSVRQSRVINPTCPSADSTAGDARMFEGTRRSLGMRSHR